MTNGKFELGASQHSHWIVMGSWFLNEADLNGSLSASRQVPDRRSQSAGRHLPQSGHAAPRGSGGSSTRRLLQRRVVRQGQRFSVSLLTSTLYTQPGVRRQRSPAGPAESLSQPAEVRRGCMFGKIRKELNECSILHQRRDIWVKMLLFESHWKGFTVIEFLVFRRIISSMIKPWHHFCICPEF